MKPQVADRYQDEGVEPVERAQSNAVESPR
jgi:hypothetical protein